MRADKITTYFQVVRDGRAVDVLGYQRFDGWVSIDTDGPFDRPWRLPSDADVVTVSRVPSTPPAHCERAVDGARAAAAARNGRLFGTDPSWYGR